MHTYIITLLSWYTKQVIIKESEYRSSLRARTLSLYSAFILLHIASSIMRYGANTKVLIIMKRAISAITTIASVIDRTHEAVLIIEKHLIKGTFRLGRLSYIRLLRTNMLELFFRRNQRATGYVFTSTLLY